MFLTAFVFIFWLMGAATCFESYPLLTKTKSKPLPLFLTALSWPFALVILFALFTFHNHIRALPLVDRLVEDAQ